MKIEIEELRAVFALCPSVELRYLANQMLDEIQQLRMRVDALGKNLRADYLQSALANVIAGTELSAERDWDAQLAKADGDAVVCRRGLASAAATAGFCEALKAIKSCAESAHLSQQQPEPTQQPAPEKN